MTTRAKLRCNSVTFSGDPRNPGTSRQYAFSAVYDDTIPEDQRFSTATPWADLKIGVSNPAVSFTPGDSYYVDFTPA